MTDVEKQNGVPSSDNSQSDDKKGPIHVLKHPVITVVAELGILSIEESLANGKIIEIPSLNIRIGKKV